MKVTGIIAEFNPLHKGHRYFLEHARAETGADYIIVVLSGNFTQRGAPAICDKHLRAQMALLAGADVVIELPVRYSVSSAEFFASSGVFLLDACGVTDHIAFGTEYGGLSELEQIASILSDEPEEYKLILKSELKKGHSFPVSRAAALLHVIPGVKDLSQILSFPNDILAIEYLKALKKSGSSIRPCPVRRLGAGFHDKFISKVNSSALAIRTAISELDSIEPLNNELPDFAFDILKENYNKCLPLYTNDFSLLLRYKLLMLLKDGRDLDGFADVPKSLSDRIKKNISSFTDLKAFIQMIKSKDMTYTRISRSLMHILLDIYSPERHMTIADGYISLLAFKESAAPLIREMNQKATIPVISNKSDAGKILTGTALRNFNDDLFASDIYNTVIEEKFNTKRVNELSRKTENINGIIS
ncbi:MAG: nucleotidyltransferase family protein [Lachnospiraceae bacterium]|nr:nucleotidyltransferase family protein [Lachnospiraceae bacterium]